VFRSRERRLTAGKMVAWVRGRYATARPIAERARKGLSDRALRSDPAAL
jgi:hypothetical protein